MSKEQLKMSDVFDLPLRLDETWWGIYSGKKQVFRPNFNFPDKYEREARAAIEAVNAFDSQQELINELVANIEAAMGIKDLWLPSGGFADNPPENYGEMEALAIMARNFENVIAKAKGEQ